MMQTPTVVCCAEIEDPEWRWIERNVTDLNLRFEFVRCTRRYAFEGISRFNFARLRGAFNAVQLARQRNAKAVVTHGPTLAAWCAMFARAYRLDVPILAHTFNFTALPSSPKRKIFSVAFSGITRFVVFSTMERELYARTFGLPIDRFDVVLWGVQEPRVDTPHTPMESGPYVCAMGGNARDYEALVEAARQLPDVRFVLVVRPESLQGLDLPVNLTAHTDIPFGGAMNILLHSRFMVLPLVGSEIPCGHVTLVAAMHLGKAFVITDSAGVRDYVRNNDNAITVPSGSVASLVVAIRRLWADPDVCARLGASGKRFAARACTEEQIVQHFRDWLAQWTDPRES